MAQYDRVALVIGNSDYPEAPLANPVNDANSMTKILEALDFKVIKRTNVNRAEFKQAIRDFDDILSSSNGVGLFYYAGHGLQNEGVNYLVPVDAKINRAYEIDDEAIEMHLVLRMMEYKNNPMNIVILDACRNNPYKRGFRDFTRGLATPDFAPKGSFIAYATAPGEVASDGDGKNGLYTQELIQALEKPNLTIEEVFKQVRNNVARKSNDRQIPWENSSLTGRFVFNMKEGADKDLGFTNPPANQEELSVTNTKVIERSIQHSLKGLAVYTDKDRPKELFTGEFISRNAQWGTTKIRTADNEVIKKKDNEFFFAETDWQLNILAEEGEEILFPYENNGFVRGMILNTSSTGEYIIKTQNNPGGYLDNKRVLYDGVFLSKSNQDYTGNYVIARTSVGIKCGIKVNNMLVYATENGPYRFYLIQDENYRDVSGIYKFFKEGNTINVGDTVYTYKSNTIMEIIVEEIDVNQLVGASGMQISKQLVLIKSE
jgi:hypothetical protein